MIPLEWASWDLKESELSVLFGNNPLTAKLHEAAAKGTNFPSAFLSTRIRMSRMTDVLLSGFSTSGARTGRGSCS